MSHIVLTFYDNIVFRWIYIYCFIYILKRMSFSILTFSSLSYTFGHVYAFFEEFDNLVYFVLGPKKILFIASPATEPKQLPRPKLFNCCFRNKKINVILFVPGPKNVKTRIHWGKNDIDLADSQQQTKQRDSVKYVKCEDVHLIFMDLKYACPSIKYNWTVYQ